MHEMRRGVIPLDIAATRLVDLGRSGRWLKCLAEGANDGILAVDFCDAFDRQFPAFALHHARVADLTTRFRVELVLLEDELELVTRLPKRYWLGLGFRRLVTNPFLLRLLLHLHPFPDRLRPPAPALDRLSRRPRSGALLTQRALEARNVD